MSAKPSTAESTSVPAYLVLTPRERQVADQILTGVPYKIVAHRLGISVRTVEIHRRNIMKKLRLRYTAELHRVMAVAQL